MLKDENFLFFVEIYYYTPILTCYVLNIRDAIFNETYQVEPH